MTNKICQKFMHLNLFIFSLLLLGIKTTTSNSVSHRLVPATAHYKCIDKERDALLDFKAHIDQDPDSRLSTWTTEKEEDYECCNWSGVTCNNRTGHVTQLDLYYYSLGGTISPSLLNFSRLSYLDLSFNYFNGTIPLFIGSMSQLSYLDLSNNSFSGTMPSTIGSLTKLTDLDLSNNSFSGTIPTSIGSLTQLTRLDLSYNYYLNGTCIPPEIGSLTNLQELSLKGLTSCIVENLYWLSNMSNLNYLSMDGTSLAKANNWVDVIINLQKLSILSLAGCELSQVMHPYSSSFLNSSSSSIDTLYLADNNLNSSMYHWLSPLTSNKLGMLDLSRNKLDVNSFGNLCNLTSLNLGYNSVAIKLPDFLNNWSGCTSVALTDLYAPYGRFTGSLSDEIQMFSSMEYMVLDHNELNGSISKKLWELPKLQSLDISSNYLKDAISENIGKSKLRDINLSNNLLEGVINTTHMSNLSYVKFIDLSSCSLGPRFPKWIQNIKNLTHLNIARNGIFDKVPVEFWNNWPFQLTYLNLSSNNISGDVPNLLSNFDPNDVSAIDLSSNKFYGRISKVPSGLVFLDLSGNKFNGGLSFLCQIAVGTLRYLDLSGNSFTGKLPDCLWNFVGLEVLNLGHNNLSGRLPVSIEHLTELQVLSLYNNSLYGELPLSLKNCTKLTFLDLGANNFIGNVPLWIGVSLPELYVLSLSSNKLTGHIPLQLCQLANLQILDLSMNNLNGTIPSCINNLTTMVQGRLFNRQNVHKVLNSEYTYGGSVLYYLETNYVDRAMILWQGNMREFSTNLGFLIGIDLSRNNLTGQIPHELVDLHGLVALNVSNNDLDGNIPWKIGDMSNLIALDLSRNDLLGEMPSSMSKMISLSYLDVSYNNLSGRIPSSTQLQSFEPSRYTGNKELCGLPLSKYCPGDKGSEVPPMVAESDDDEKELDDLRKWFYIGGASGFPIGFWIVCGTLLLNRHASHAFFHFSESLRDMVYVNVLVFVAKLKRFACK